MAKISIELPSVFPFATTISVRITDLNYGGHVGNDTILSLMHEARMQFLLSFGYSEKNLAGTGMIMSSVSIVFKNELFYGDIVNAHITVADMTGAGFDILYKFEKEKEGGVIPVIHARTGMVCFDYEKRKIAPLPQEVRNRWQDILSS